MRGIFWKAKAINKCNTWKRSEKFKSISLNYRGLAKYLLNHKTKLNPKAYLYPFRFIPYAKNYPFSQRFGAFCKHFNGAEH